MVLKKAVTGYARDLFINLSLFFFFKKKGNIRVVKFFDMMHEPKQMKYEIKGL